MSENENGGGDKKLTANEKGVLGFVQAQPAPRTAKELARGFQTSKNVLAGLPDLAEKGVTDTLAALVKKKKLKEGDKTPEGEPVLEVA